MGNTLSQAEIDFLLNSGGFKTEASPVAEPPPAVVAVQTRQAQTMPPPDPAPAKSAIVNAFELKPRKYSSLSNPLGAQIFDFKANPQVRVLKGSAFRDYTIPNKSMMSVEDVQHFDLARSAVIKLLQVSKKFREKKRHGLVHEVAHCSSVYGHKISFFVLRSKHKPVRLKVQDVPVYTLNHKLRSLERTIEWEYDEQEPESFVFEWGQWFSRNFDQPTLEKMAQLA